jgi:hypothetical protein
MLRAWLRTIFRRIRIYAVRTSKQGAMIDKPDTDCSGGDVGREMRLRAALRENLKRRKSQSRGRADQAAAANADRIDPECGDE